MRALDTNVLARFYCEDPHDPESERQRPIARRIVIESPSLYVPLSVVLELEWVMRGFYGIDVEGVCGVIEHLLGMPHVTVERWDAVRDAVQLHRTGIDFADALHLTGSASCDSLITFDKRFARAAQRARTATGVELAR